MTLLVLIAFVYLLFAYQNYLNNQNNNSAEEKARGESALKERSSTIVFVE